MSEAKVDNGLRTSFCSAANYLTQLYMASLRQEKLAYKEGYCEAMDTICQWVQANLQHGSTTLSARGLLEFARSSKTQVQQSLSSSSLETPAGVNRLNSASSSNAVVSSSSVVGSQDGDDIETEEDSQSNVSTMGSQFSNFNTNHSSLHQDPHRSAHPMSTSHSMSTQNSVLHHQPLPNTSTSHHPLTSSSQSTFGGFGSSQPSSSSMFPFSAPPSGSANIFGPPPSQSPQVSFTASTAPSTTPSLSGFDPNPNVTGSPRPSNPRKRRFFEFLFDSPGGGDVQNSLHPLFIHQQQQQETSTTTTTSNAGSSGNVEGLAMDVLGYAEHPQSWKRSRLNDTVMISNNG